MGVFRVTLLPTEAGKTSMVLCDSGDPLPTHNIRFNTRPVYQADMGFEADYASMFFQGNVRNLLSFEVTRTKDDSSRLFTGPAAAMIYMFKFSQKFPGIWTAKIELRDTSGGGTFFMRNTAVEAADITDIKGAKLGYTFVLNGGEIANSP